MEFISSIIKFLWTNWNAEVRRLHLGGGLIYLEKSYLMGDSGLSIYNYKLIASVKAAKHNTKNISSTLIMIKDFTKKMYNLRMSYVEIDKHVHIECNSYYCNLKKPLKSDNWNAEALQSIVHKIPIQNNKLTHSCDGWTKTLPANPTYCSPIKFFMSLQPNISLLLVPDLNRLKRGTKDGR